MSTAFGVRSSLRSAAARRIEAAGLAFQRQLQREAKKAAEARPAVTARSPHHAEAASAVRRERAPKGQCHRIVEEVAAKYGVTASAILSGSRARLLIPPRHEAMYRCVAETTLSLPAIGRIFKRDHTSIGHGVMRHHIRTGDPLPRGMDWKAGRRKRR
jgi:chromosomal replication initiation ATPase DnaA